MQLVVFFLGAEITENSAFFQISTKFVQKSHPPIKPKQPLPSHIRKLQILPF